MIDYETRFLTVDTFLFSIQDITNTEEKPIHLISFCLNRNYNKRPEIILPQPLNLPN